MLFRSEGCFRAFRANHWLGATLFAGVLLMIPHLTLAGLTEASLWQSGAPWMESVRAARIHWLGRVLSAIPLFAGFISFLIGLTTGPRGAGMAEVEASIGLEPVEHVSPRLAEAS